MANELPDFRIVVQGKQHHSGKTLILSILNRALKDAGFTDVEVTHDNTAEYFDRMTPEQLENVRNNSPEFFDKKIELVEQIQRLREVPSPEPVKESGPTTRLYADD